MFISPDIKEPFSKWLNESEQSFSTVDVTGNFIPVDERFVSKDSNILAILKCVTDRDTGKLRVSS